MSCLCLCLKYSQLYEKLMIKRCVLYLRMGVMALVMYSCEERGQSSILCSHCLVEEHQQLLFEVLFSWVFSGSVSGYTVYHYCCIWRTGRMINSNVSSQPPKSLHPLHRGTVWYRPRAALCLSGSLKSHISYSLSVLFGVRLFTEQHSVSLWTSSLLPDLPCDESNHSDVFWKLNDEVGGVDLYAVMSEQRAQYWTWQAAMGSISVKCNGLLEVFYPVVDGL